MENSGINLSARYLENFLSWGLKLGQLIGDDEEII